MDNDTNYTEVLSWINSSVDPNLGGRNTFNALITKSKILKKLGNETASAAMLGAALDNDSVQELHKYGRQLLNKNKIPEAFEVFNKNFTKNKAAWLSNAGMMRIYSAMGNYKKALEHAKAALPQAPDAQIKTMLENAIKTLGEGRAL